MMSFWIGFFRDAGIIECDVEDFAVSFINHRIRKNMLPDLNKDYLSEMGITAMGDIIAILRQAKAVLEEPFHAVVSSVQPPCTAVTSGLETHLIKLEKCSPQNQLSDNNRRSVRLGRRSTPASSMVDHFLAEAKFLSDNMSQPLQDLKEFESVSRGCSVFGQLGYDAPYVHDTFVHCRPALPDQSDGLEVTISRATPTLCTSKLVDLRQVRKRSPNPPCHDFDDCDSDELECQYAGVVRKLYVPGKKGSNPQGPMDSTTDTEGMFGLNAN